MMKDESITLLVVLEKALDTLVCYYSDGVDQIRYLI
jgi:hypothetical protein